MKPCTQQYLLAHAIMLASTVHRDQYDKAGKPYILHPLHVMNTVKSKDPEVLQIAVMHDLIEDTPMTIDDLGSMGFSSRVRDALWLLTHDMDDSYETYIESICTNRDAMLVKLADLKHNSDITRLRGVSAKDLKRMEKYHTAYIKIKSKLKELPQ